MCERETKARKSMLRRRELAGALTMCWLGFCAISFVIWSAQRNAKSTPILYTWVGTCLENIEWPAALRVLRKRAALAA